MAEEAEDILGMVTKGLGKIFGEEDSTIGEAAGKLADTITSGIEDVGEGKASGVAKGILNDIGEKFEVGEGDTASNFVNKVTEQVVDEGGSSTLNSKLGNIISLNKNPGSKEVLKNFSKYIDTNALNEGDVVDSIIGNMDKIRNSTSMDDSVNTVKQDLYSKMADKVDWSNEKLDMDRVKKAGAGIADLKDSIGNMTDDQLKNAFSANDDLRAAYVGEGVENTKNSAFERAKAQAEAEAEEKAQESAQEKAQSFADNIDTAKNKINKNLKDGEWNPAKKYKASDFEDTSEGFSAFRLSQQMNRLSTEKGRVIDAFDSGKLTDSQAGIFGAKNLSGLSREQIDNYYTKKMGGLNTNTTIGDKLIYHQVPGKAAAIGTTAFLVQSLFANKGKQSNAELYGMNQQQQGQ